MGDVMIAAIIIIVLQFLIIGGLSYVLYKFVKRALQMDEILQYLVDDIDVNLRQFAKMASSALLTGDQEIQNAHKNMMVMGKRLEEIVVRVQEASGVNLRVQRPPTRPPVVD